MLASPMKKITRHQPPRLAALGQHCNENGGIAAPHTTAAAMGLTPRTPRTPRTQSAVDCAFISSSPQRPTPKAKGGGAHRHKRTPSGTMFSPTYPSPSAAGASVSSATIRCGALPLRQQLARNQRKLSPNSRKASLISLSPTQKSLRENISLHGNSTQLYDDYTESDFDPYHFIATLPLIQAANPVSQTRQIWLPPKLSSAPMLTLVLDLDETLVHCSTDAADIPNPDFQFQVQFNGATYLVNARKRPGFEEFMEHIKGKFEVVVFTASQRVYAEKLLDIIDATGTSIHHRVFREGCVCVEGNYLKDLSVLGRDLAHTVIVDNSPQAFAFQLDNGIPILSWFESGDDRELYKILPLLDRLAQEEKDVRSIVRNIYRLYEKVEERRVGLSILFQDEDQLD